MNRDASTASAATSTSTTTTTTPTRALTSPSPWQSKSPLHQTQRHYPPRSLFTSPRPRIRESIPEFSMSRQDPSRKLFKPVVSSGRGFMPMADPPFRIREPIPEISTSQQDPSRKLFNPVVSSGRGFMPMANPPLRIREPIPEFSMSQQDPPQKISHPVVSSGRGFMPRAAGSVSTDQTVTVANLGRNTAGAVVGSSRCVRPPPLDYLRPSVHKARAPTSLHQLQRKSPLESSRLSLAKGDSPSASPKIMPPSSSAEFRDSKETRKRINDETFAVVRDRKVRIPEGASLYSLCRSWFRNGLPEQEYQLPHENYKMNLPKPLPRAVASATQSEEKEDNKEETKNEEKEESVDHLAPEDLLKEHIMRGKRVRSRLREERLERISRYKHRLTLLLPKDDTNSGD